MLKFIIGHKFVRSALIITCIKCKFNKKDDSTIFGVQIQLIWEVNEQKYGISSSHSKITNRGINRSRKSEWKTQKSTIGQEIDLKTTTSSEETIAFAFTKAIFPSLIWGLKRAHAEASRHSPTGDLSIILRDKFLKSISLKKLINSLNIIKKLRITIITCYVKRTCSTSNLSGLDVSIKSKSAHKLDCELRVRSNHIKLWLKLKNYKKSAYKKVTW